MLNKLQSSISFLIQKFQFEGNFQDNLMILVT